MLLAVKLRGGHFLLESDFLFSNKKSDSSKKSPSHPEALFTETDILLEFQCLCTFLLLVHSRPDNISGTDQKTFMDLLGTGLEQEGFPINNLKNRDLFSPRGPHNALHH